MSSDMEQPVVNIVGERVALGPLVREYIPLFARWGNDFAVARTFGGIPRARTIEAVTARYDTGNPLGFLEAAIAFALRDHNMGGPVREMLTSFTQTVPSGA